MIQEERQLLLKDLCARLPYEVKCAIFDKKIKFGGFDGKYPFILDGITVESDGVDVWFEKGNFSPETIKPYLRPLSSMTPQEWCDLCDCVIEDDKAATIVNGRRFVSHVNEERFLNSNHFDYCGLIEKGLALEAPEGMYKED